MTDTPAVWSFDAIGTRWEIETGDPLPGPAREAVTALIADFDRTWSRFRDDSLVARLAASGGTAELPSDAPAMLDAYAEAGRVTAGAVNPLVGGVLARRGYDADLSFDDRGPQPAPGEWEDLLSWNGGALTLAAPAVIDVGAVGKGRLVDLVAETLAGWATDLVVDASGDLRVRGAAVRVGLEHPYDQRRAIGAVELRDAALCASATNRRAWGDGLHHVLDARTGEPVRTTVATWAIAPDALHADAVATALFFDGGPELAAGWGVEWVRMSTDGRVEWSPRSPFELFF